MSLLANSCISDTGRSIRHVLYKTENRKEILTGLMRTDRPDIKDGYLLYAGIQSKGRGLFRGYSSNSYVITVIPGDPEPRLYVALIGNTMYNFLGKDIGHAEPDGECHEGGEFARLIYDYYCTHKEKIFTQVYAPDFSRFKPLLVLPDNWMALLSCRRIDSLPIRGNGDMILEYEMVSTNKIVNYRGELQSWSICKKLVHLIPSGSNYTERIKEYPILFYEHGRRKPQIIKPQYPDWTSFNSIYPHDKAILDYYLETTGEKEPGQEQTK